MTATTPVFKVVKPGPQSTVQDLGRVGYLHMGMPQAGAQDPLALKLANQLAGNPSGGQFGSQSADPGPAALEVLMAGLHVEALASVTVALTGADLGPKVNGAPVGSWETIHLKVGDELVLSTLNHGLRGYLGISGGIAVEPVLGSRATYLRGAIGGFGGRALKAGDILEAYDSQPARTLRVPEEKRPPSVGGEIRVVLGPQDDLYATEGIDAFLSLPWQLLPASDRMGFRLAGPSLQFASDSPHQMDDHPSSIVDDFIPLGGIQTPSDGLIIVMGVDGPSLGGFSKIATVCSVDFGVLAQTRPGQQVRFSAIDWADAVHLAAWWSQRIDQEEIVVRA